ncbi:hypothetical protein [Blastomonas fulva]|uniref:J domain-containing protein n=1 Tax=Blastomonas fulva TaxID=1550728 RepID=A0ABM6MAR2_9SPHN|nr:hypothetical protein [Blastomonas fulva]ASR53172.1 hypothetical protein B5J99_18315 [Blastomonas fulva]
MSLADDWQVLGIVPTDDRREIKRAYSGALKGIDVDADPASFIRLRQALENALEWGVDTPWWDEEAAEAITPALIEEEPLADDELDAEEWAVDEQWEGPSDQWRLPPPICEGELGKAMSQLDLLLFELQGDPAEIARLGHEILGSKELEHVDTASATDEWMADTIAAAIPASDPLISPSIKHFGWDRAQSSRASYAVRAVLDREEDRRSLAAFAKPSHPHHRAFQELRGSGRTRVSLFQEPLVNDVADFLAVVRTWHPTIEKDLAGPNFDWWQGYLASRRLPLHFWKLMIAGSFLLGFTALVLLPKGMGGAAIPLVVLGSISLSYALIRGAMELRRIARRLHDQQGPNGIYAHLPLLSASVFGSPLLLAAVPSGTVQLILSLVLSASLAVLIYLRCAPPQWDDAATRWSRSRFPIGAGIVSICILFEVNRGLALQLVAPLALCCWFGERGWHPWAQFIDDAPPRKRVMLYALAFGTIMLGATVVIIGVSADPSPMLLVCVPLAILLQHLVLAATPAYFAWIEWPLRVVAVLFYWTVPVFREETGDGLGRFTLAAMLYLVLFCLVKIVARLLQWFRPAI